MTTVSLSLVVPTAIAAISLALLGASGAAKVLEPDPTSGALAAAGLPASTSVSRSLGGLEIAAAALGLSAGGLAVAPAALLYAGFTLFTLAALRRRIPLQSCGCFGREDTPPSLVHVIFNTTSVIALVWVGIRGGYPFPWGAGVVEGSIYAGLVVLGAYASYLLLARLPVVLRLTRGV